MADPARTGGGTRTDGRMQARGCSFADEAVVHVARLARNAAPAGDGRTWADSVSGFPWFVAHMLGFLLPDLEQVGRSFA